jgi:nicotinamide-nucleotide amidase
MNIAIITIGDEILIGQIVNTNAAWISAQVTRVGGRVLEQVTVPDDAQTLTDTLDRCRRHCDVLLLTGGLGPTHDDITKDVLTAYFRDELVEDPATTARLQEWMQRRGRSLSERNAQQAWIPSTCIPLPNPVGTAPGMLFDRDGLLLVSMPGVPTEMRAMIADHVLPLLRERIDAEARPTWEYRTVYTTGIAESDLADMIGEPTAFLHGASLAFLPNYQGVRLRIGVRGLTSTERLADLDRIEGVLRDRAGAFIFGVGEATLAATVGHALRDRGETVSVAESCTSGLLGAALTDIPGSSAWFPGGVLSYANDVKVRDLGVRQADLDRVGAVSEEVARQMAEGVRTRFGTTYGIGITGIAGPDGGTPEKPVGTVWIAVATPTQTLATRFSFGGDRSMNRERSVGAALGMLWKVIR